MNRQNGLYVAISGNQILERTAVTRKGTVSFPATTVADELMRFWALDVEGYRIFSETVNQRINEAMEVTRDTETGRIQVHPNPDLYRQAIQAIYAQVDSYEKDDPFDGALLRVTLDHYAYHSLSGLRISSGAGEELKFMVGEVIDTYMLMMDLLQDLKNGVHPEADDPFNDWSHLTVQQFLTYENGAIRTHYCFHSHYEYYMFLMLRYMAGNPNVCQCRRCGRYFIPRTKRRTLYCDRVVRDGLTCKDLGPAEKHRQMAENDSVVDAFDRNMRKMRKRLERAEDEKQGQELEDVRESVWSWLARATAARDGYLAGKVSQKEALRVICGA